MAMCTWYSRPWCFVSASSSSWRAPRRRWTTIGATHVVASRMNLCCCCQSLMLEPWRCFRSSPCLRNARSDAVEWDAWREEDALASPRRDCASRYLEYWNRGTRVPLQEYESLGSRVHDLDGELVSFARDSIEIPIRYFQPTIHMRNLLNEIEWMNGWIRTSSINNVRGTRWIGLIKRDSRPTASDHEAFVAASILSTANAKVSLRIQILKAREARW